MKLDALRSKLGYQTVLLGSVVLLTSAALALASRVTEPDIRAAALRDLRQSLAQVLPGRYDNDLLEDTVVLAAAEGEVTVHRARRGGRVEAVVFQTVGQGYAGPIVCIMGVSREGQLLGVRVHVVDEVLAAAARFFCSRGFRGSRRCHLGFGRGLVCGLRCRRLLLGATRDAKCHSQDQQ